MPVANPMRQPRGYRKRSAAGNEFSAFGSMFEANTTTPNDHTFYEILIT